jgi:secreted PhoX family phosphatase
LHSFTRDEGDGPEDKLVFDNAGNLYGTTDREGAYQSGCDGYGCGTAFQAFQLRPGTNGFWTLKVLHSFGKGK